MLVDNLDAVINNVFSSVSFPFPVIIYALCRRLDYSRFYNQSPDTPLPVSAQVFYIQALMPCSGYRSIALWMGSAVTSTAARH